MLGSTSRRLQHIKCLILWFRTRTDDEPNDNLDNDDESDAGFDVDDESDDDDDSDDDYNFDAVYFSVSAWLWQW